MPRNGLDLPGFEQAAAEMVEGIRARLNDQPWSPLDHGPALALAEPRPGRAAKEGPEFPTNPRPSHTATGSSWGWGRGADPRCYRDGFVWKGPAPSPWPSPGAAHGKTWESPSLTPCPEVVRTDAPPPHARRAAATERRLPRRSARPAPGRPEIRARDRRSARHLAPDEAAAWREFVRDAVPGVLTDSDRMALEALARLLARSRRQGLTSAELGHLRGFLAELGATPASRGRVRPAGPPRRAIHGTCRPARGRHRPSGHAGAVRLAVSGQSRTVRNG